MSIIEVFTLLALVELGVYGLYLLGVFLMCCIKGSRQIANKKELIHRAQQAIRNAVRLTLSDEDDLVVNHEICPICIELFEPNDDVIILPCSHEFHGRCIKNWLLVKRTCPVCKDETLKGLGLELNIEEERLWQEEIDNAGPDRGIYFMYNMIDYENSADENPPPVDNENRDNDNNERDGIMGDIHYD